MKIVRGIAISVICMVFGSCFDPPNYPNVPSIELESIEYVDDQMDSLILTLSFKDGNGDLGLPSDDPSYRSFPYNDAFFFQENNGELLRLHTFSRSSQTLDIIHIDNPTIGNLVFPRTRKNPAYTDNVPAFVFPYTCSSYNYRSILIEQADSAVLDKTVKTTLVDIEGDKYLQIQDTLLFEPNPDHHNIEIDFFVKDPQHPEADDEGFYEYDWRTDGCDRVRNVGVTFDARFPVLTENDETTLEGTLKYGMYSIGFKEVFGNRTLRLKITIKDRALLRSNTIITEDFTLLGKLKKK